MSVLFLLVITVLSSCGEEEPVYRMTESDLIAIMGEFVTREDGGVAHFRKRAADLHFAGGIACGDTAMAPLMYEGKIEDLRGVDGGQTYLCSEFGDDFSSTEFKYEARQRFQPFYVGDWRVELSYYQMTGVLHERHEEEKVSAGAHLSFSFDIFDEVHDTKYFGGGFISLPTCPYDVTEDMLTDVFDGTFSVSAESSRARYDGNHDTRVDVDYDLREISFEEFGLYQDGVLIHTID